MKRGHLSGHSWVLLVSHCFCSEHKYSGLLLRGDCESQLLIPSQPLPSGSYVTIIPSFVVGWWHLLQEALSTPLNSSAFTMPQRTRAYYQLSVHPRRLTVSLAYLLSRWGLVNPGLNRTLFLCPLACLAGLTSGRTH